MHSTLYQKQNDDPHDVLVVAPALVVPTDEELSRLAQTMRQSSDPPARAESDHAAGAAIPPVDTTFRPTVSDAPGRGRTVGGRAARGFTAALLLALCAGAAAFAWRAYGDEGKSMIAQWVPQRVLALILPLEKPAPAEQPTPPAVEAAAVDTLPAQPAPSPPAVPEAAAPAAAAPSVEPAEQLRSMARDLASAGQQIEQLKASIEDLKASQQQMSREIAKASEAKASEAKASEARPSEQNLRPKMSALPPRPAPARARKPLPPLPHPQAATYPATPQTAAPYVPQQVEPPPQATTQTLGDPELASVPRPPMPVR
jgi:hypothetical protein